MRIANGKTKLILSARVGVVNCSCEDSECTCLNTEEVLMAGDIAMSMSLRMVTIGNPTVGTFSSVLKTSLKSLRTLMHGEITVW